MASKQPPIKQFWAWLGSKSIDPRLLTTDKAETLLTEWGKTNTIPNPKSKTKKVAKEMFIQAFFKAVYNKYKTDKPEWFKVTKDVYETGKFISSAWTEFIYSPSALMIPSDPQHKKQVEIALEQGKDIPKEVLADYPSLTAKPNKDLKKRNTKDLKAVKQVRYDNEEFNVLVPKDSKKEFYGYVYINDLRPVAKKVAPELYKVTNEQLEKLKDPTYQDALNLYHMNQISHGGEFEMPWTLSFKDKATEPNIDKIVDLLGLPKGKAIYVNYYNGTTYYTFDELKKRKGLWYRHVLEHKPIVDLQWEFNKHQKKIKEFESKMEKLINPKTKKPRGKDKIKYASLERELEERKSAIKQLEKLSNKKATPMKKPTVKIGDEDFDCDDLAERERKKLSNRRKSTAKRSKKRESTKNVEKVEKATDLVEKSIDKRMDQGKTVSVSEVETMIKSTKGLITKLEGLYKKAV